jgi:signal transduction histidine kinase
MKTREVVDPKVQQIYSALAEEHAVRVDKIFLKLFAAQSVIALFAAAWSAAHGDGYLALQIASVSMALFFIPFAIFRRFPGLAVTRFTNGVAQALYSILFIQLTSGHTETYAHVFISLVFLAAYRDFRPLLASSLITYGHHLWQSDFWQAFEHAGWISFEDIILFYLMTHSHRQLWAQSKSQAALIDSHAKLALTLIKVELLNNSLERKVSEGENQLLASQELLHKQQQSLIASSKMSALGEMAGGIAHEINNPLGIIHGKANLLLKQMRMDLFSPEGGEAELKKIVAMTERISKIVQGLRSFSRTDAGDEPAHTSLNAVIENAISLCTERYKARQLALEIDAIPDVALICRSVQIEQVLLNLLNNAYDAVEPLDERWVRLSFEADHERVQIVVTDSGDGIAPEVVTRMMQLFFTTKEKGRGTGLGLSISQQILEAHGGRLTYNDQCPNTQFIIELPLKPVTALTSAS